MLSQGNAFDKLKKIKLAVDYWKQNGTFNRFSHTLQIIYDLQSGSINEFIYQFNWKVVLLCFLTVIYPSKNTISKVFQDFSKHYLSKIDDENKEGTILSQNNLHFALIKLYSNLEYSCTNSDAHSKENEKYYSDSMTKSINDIARTTSLINNTYYYKL